MAFSYQEVDRRKDRQPVRWIDTLEEEYHLMFIYILPIPIISIGIIIVILVSRGYRSFVPSLPF